jgi:hypothetical protein
MYGFYFGNRNGLAIAAEKRVEQIKRFDAYT